MPRKKRIEQYEHKGKTRVNNPEVGLGDAALEPPEQKKTYSYDPHLDPQLQWAGKAERTSFEVPSVSLHVHERIDPRTIIEAVRRKNGNGAQMSLFSAREMNPPLREANRQLVEEATKWVGGLDRIHKARKILGCYDFSATPFAPSGKQATEEALFGWVVSDFGLNDAIESGLVKTPRIVVRDDALPDARTYKSRLYHIYMDPEVK